MQKRPVCPVEFGSQSLQRLFGWSARLAPVDYLSRPVLARRAVPTARGSFGVLDLTLEHR